jgi:uncharacterized RDD family membrane protein YckC
VVSAGPGNHELEAKEGYMVPLEARPNAVAASALVGVWPRCLAQVFDIVLISVVAAAIQVLLSPREFAFGAGTILIWLLVALVYFVAAEGIWSTSAGKWLMGLVVVRMDGSDPGLRAAGIRTVARLVDGLCFYAVGALLIWSSGRHQRLGDRLAGTLVVRVDPGPRLRSDGTHVLASQVPLASTSPQPPHTTSWLPNPSEDVDELPPPSALPTWDYHPPAGQETTPRRQ